MGFWDDFTKGAIAGIGDAPRWESLKLQRENLDSDMYHQAINDILAATKDQKDPKQRKESMLRMAATIGVEHPELGNKITATFSVLPDEDAAQISATNAIARVNNEMRANNGIASEAAMYDFFKNVPYEHWSTTVNTLISTLPSSMQKVALDNSEKVLDVHKKAVEQRGFMGQKESAAWQKGVMETVGGKFGEVVAAPTADDILGLGLKKTQSDVDKAEQDAIKAKSDVGKNQIELDRMSSGLDLDVQAMNMANNPMGWVLMQYRLGGKYSANGLPGNAGGTPDFKSMQKAVFELEENLKAIEAKYKGEKDTSKLARKFNDAVSTYINTTIRHPGHQAYLSNFVDDYRDKYGQEGEDWNPVQAGADLYKDHYKELGYVDVRSGDWIGKPEDNPLNKRKIGKEKKAISIPVVPQLGGGSVIVKKHEPVTPKPVEVAPKKEEKKKPVREGVKGFLDLLRY